MTQPFDPVSFSVPLPICLHPADAPLQRRATAHHLCTRAVLTLVAVLVAALSARAQPLPDPPFFLREVAPPSPEFTTYVVGELVRVSIPSNWRELPVPNAVTFAPYGGYGIVGAARLFTHGVAMGLARNDAGDLVVTTDAFVASQVLDARAGRPPLQLRDVVLADRPGLRVSVWTVSKATGEPERVDVYTTLLRTGDLFYVMAVTPRQCALDYISTFRRVVGSIEILDCVGCTR